MKIEDTARFQAKKLDIAFYRFVDALGFIKNRYVGDILI